MENSFDVRPCKGSAACVATVKRKTKLDLSEVKKHFSQVVVDIPMMLVVTYKGVNINIYPQGKLLIRVRDTDEAQEIASKIYKMIL
jgi:hypothetical protein